MIFRGVLIRKTNLQFQAKIFIFKCRDTLQQLVAFLLSYVKWDDYAKRMPTVGELLTEFRLPLDAAMFLVRPTYMPKVDFYKLYF